MKKDRLQASGLRHRGRANDSGKIISYDSSGIFIREYYSISNPMDIVQKNNRIYMVAGSFDDSIKIIDSSGKMDNEFGGQGSSTGQFGLNSYLQTAISSNNHLFITDGSNNRIQIFDSIGTFKNSIQITDPLGIAFIDGKHIAVSSVPTGSAGDISIMDTSGIISQQWNAWTLKVAVTANGNIIGVNSDNQRIAIYSPNGSLILVFGKLGGAVSDFTYPRCVSAYNGKLFVADNEGQKVLEFKIPANL